MALDRQRSAALVPDQIAAAATHQPEAPRHGDFDRDSALAQAGDLRVLLEAGDEENDDGESEGDKTKAADNTANTTSVYVHARAAKSRYWLAGGVGRAGCLLGLVGDLSSGSCWLTSH
jgi:hypothetical protein